MIEAHADCVKQRVVATGLLRVRQGQVVETKLHQLKAPVGCPSEYPLIAKVQNVKEIESDVILQAKQSIV